MSANKALMRLLKPRFILALIVVLALLYMMFTEVLSPEVGITVIIGVLTAFGAYEKVKGGK